MKHDVLTRQNAITTAQDPAALATSHECITVLFAGEAVLRAGGVRALL